MTSLDTTSPPDDNEVILRRPWGVKICSSSN